MVLVILFPPKLVFPTFSTPAYVLQKEQNRTNHPPLKNDVHLLTQVLFILEKIGFFIFLFLFLLSSYYIGISLAENIYCINRKISRLLGKQFWLVLLTQANRKKLVGCCVLKQHQFLFFQFIQLFVCTDENANLTFIFFISIRISQIVNALLILNISISLSNKLFKDAF